MTNKAEKGTLDFGIYLQHSLITIKSSMLSSPLNLTPRIPEDSNTKSICIQFPKTLDSCNNNSLLTMTTNDDTSESPVLIFELEQSSLIQQQIAPGQNLVPGTNTHSIAPSCKVTRRCFHLQCLVKNTLCKCKEHNTASHISPRGTDKAVTLSAVHTSQPFGERRRRPGD